MEQPNQQHRTDNSNQSNQQKDKENPQKTKKMGVENSQSQEGIGKHPGKVGQNEDHDVDERTNVSERGGDFKGGTQRQPENAGAGRQQQFDAENDEETESNRKTQPSRTGRTDKNSQSNADSDKGNNRQSNNPDPKASK